MKLRATLLTCSLTLSAFGLTGCVQMGDVKDIAACQAFAAAQTAYDKAANGAMAAPDDKAKQVEWMGAWMLFTPGISAAASLPTTQSLKSELGTYSKAVNDAGPGASASTQIELWKKGFAKKIVTLCVELAAPIEITDLNVK